MNIRPITAEWRRFMGVDPHETVELVYFNSQKKPVTAYARSFDDHCALLAKADSQQVTGCYTIFNQLHEGLHARYGEGKWVEYASRASDQDVTKVRAIYLDFDAKRPRDISANDHEKEMACEVANETYEFLSKRLGTECLGVGDSGNGIAIFIAMVPVPPSKLTSDTITNFLQMISNEFSTQYVKVDSSVANPARLCPAFGTWKRKGVNVKERPHRLTTFTCQDEITRLTWEEF
jgi:hypothetical protein